MRYAGVFGRTALVLVAVIMAVTALAIPAYAQVVVTTTQTFYVAARNADATVTTTWVDGVLTSRTYQEVSRATGRITLERSWTFWPNGTISHFEETRTSLDGSFQSTLIQDRDQNGFIREQYVKLVSNGETIAEQFTSYDASGYLIYQEDRILTTLADGTREWLVTIDPDGSGVLASYTKTYPYGYDFNATLPERPGYGYGDENHKHTGAPGQAEGGSAGGANGNGSGGTSNPVEERPGYGHGDENHDHSRGRSQEFTK